MTRLLNLLILSSEKKIIIGNFLIMYDSRCVPEAPIGFFHPGRSFNFSPNRFFWGEGLDPFRAPEPLPILNSSNFVPKNGFPVVKGLRLSQIEENLRRKKAAMNGWCTSIVARVFFKRLSSAIYIAISRRSASETVTRAHRMTRRSRSLTLAGCFGEAPWSPRPFPSCRESRGGQDELSIATSGQREAQSCPCTLKKKTVGIIEGGNRKTMGTYQVSRSKLWTRVGRVRLSC